MLKTRIITALFILPIVLVALFEFPNWAWDVFTLGIALVACWEWSRFCRLSLRGTRVFFALSGVIATGIFLAYLAPVQLGAEFRLFSLAGFMLAAVFWAFVAPIWLAKTWRPSSAWVAAFTGWVVIFPTWLAFLQLHDMSPWVLLTFALIVWVADVFAYFVGKAIGRHKLAPAISPGKTIEGAIGGLLGVVLYFFLWWHLTTTLAWARELHTHATLLFTVFVALGVLSVVGDLFESWMKRGVGLKDSSNLLPGHGGFLDRIDALTSTLPLAALFAMLAPRVVQ